VIQSVTAEHRLEGDRNDDRNDMGMFMRIALARLLVGGCAVAFSVCVLIEHAQAQVPYVPPPAKPPPPAFNPSSPYTVPQPSYKSISPAAPSTAPGYQVASPADERLARTAVRSHRRTPTRKTRSVRHRSRPVVGITPESYSYYYSGFGYDYGCVWRRAWDGYWFRTSPCS
jgi:hypothetical protein